MLVLKQALDLCEPAARTAAIEAVTALVAVHPNTRPLIAHRVYLACRARDAEPGYLPKKIQPDSRFEDNLAEIAAQRENEKASTAPFLEFDPDTFSTEVEDILCDALEALSGHEPLEQNKIAARLVDVVTQADADIRDHEANSVNQPEMNGGEELH